MTMKATVFNGIDQIESVDALLKGKRLGLITNPTGTRKDLTATIDLLNERYQLTALYSPEHGVRGDAQAGVKIADRVDPLTGVMAYSLYGEGDQLTEENTKDVDMIVVDIQDVGARFYTYLYTMSYSMACCKKLGLPMVVFDRINPIGGVKVEGTILDERFRSFVGDYGLPTRTGITIGELARYLAGTRPEEFACELTVVPCKGWKRDLYADETDLSWVIPSPNLPTIDGAELYIGTCVFEGPNVSEGRGTTIPFEIIGAPWLKSYEVVEAMQAKNLPGVKFRAGCFTPTFSKHQGELCYAVQPHVTDRRAFRSFETGLYLLEVIRDLHPDHFEYRFVERPQDGRRYFLDSLMGTDQFRTGALSCQGILEANRAGLEAYQKAIKPYLLYE